METTISGLGFRGFRAQGTDIRHKDGSACNLSQMTIRSSPEYVTLVFA